MSLAADLVVVLHFGFISFVVWGGFLALRWRRAPWLHVPAALWGVFIQVSGGVCPLTPLENSLRESAGTSGYEEGFVEHYLVPIIYPPGLTPARQWVLAGLLVAINGVAYTWVWRRRR